MKSFVSPSKLITEVENTMVIFDDMEEEIIEEAKCFIDIASDSQVIEEMSKARYIDLHYFIRDFSTCRTKEVSTIYRFNCQQRNE